MVQEEVEVPVGEEQDVRVPETSAGTRILWGVLLFGSFWGVFSTILAVNDSVAESETQGEQTRARLEIKQITATDSKGADRRTGVAPIDVDFHAEFVAGPQEPATFLWDFGDGVGSIERAIRYTYRYGGRYTVRLTVTDGAGRTDTKTLVVSYTGPPQVVAAPQEQSIFNSRNPAVVGQEMMEGAARKVSSWFKGGPPVQMCHPGKNETLMGSDGRTPVLDAGTSDIHIDENAEFDLIVDNKPGTVDPALAVARFRETGRVLYSNQLYLMDKEGGLPVPRVITFTVTPR